MSPIVACHGEMWIILMQITRSNWGNWDAVCDSMIPFSSNVSGRGSRTWLTRMESEIYAWMDARDDSCGSVGNHWMGLLFVISLRAKWSVWTPAPAATSKMFRVSSLATSRSSGRTLENNTSQMGSLLRWADGDSSLVMANVCENRRRTEWFTVTNEYDGCGRANERENEEENNKETKIQNLGRWGSRWDANEAMDRQGSSMTLSFIWLIVRFWNSILYLRPYRWSCRVEVIRVPHTVTTLKSAKWQEYFVIAFISWLLSRFNFLPFITVIITDYFGSFKCLWTDTYRVQNGCLSYTGHTIYIQEVFTAVCLEKWFLKTPLEWSIRDLLIVKTSFFSYFLLSNNSQLSIINYLLLPISSPTFYLVTISLAFHVYN